MKKGLAMSSASTVGATAIKENERTLDTLTIAEVERDLAVLSVHAPEETLLHWLNRSDVLLARSKQVRQTVEQIAIGWINANGQIQCGPVLYSVGKVKQVKCVDPLKCMELLLEACGGSVQQGCSYLRSDPFRYGACSQVLPESQWNSVFAVDWEDKLVLKRTDTRFVPQKIDAPLHPPPTDGNK
jgi:hypothetical protein